MVNVGPGGGGGSITVTAGTGCAWGAISQNPDFITITPFSSASGNGSVSFSVAPNEGAARTGTIIIADQPVTVTQGSGCLFSLDITDQSFAANGGSGSIIITAGLDCTWMADSNASWIIVQSGDNGTGIGAVTYSVVANPNPVRRTGSITVAGRSFTVHQGAAFLDVSLANPFYTEIGKLSARGVTLGCDANNFCPSDVVTRQQMAAFIIRALGDFNPPPPAQQRFFDVPPANPFYAFIEQMAIRQITLGCGAGNYCPADAVLRDQMAAFIIRSFGEFNPPQPPFQRFLDVPPMNPFYRFIDRMAVLQITLGCGGGNYCPNLSVKREQMAAFLVRAFNL
jgi:hypothetical protein